MSDAGTRNSERIKELEAKLAECAEKYLELSLKYLDVVEKLTQNNSQPLPSLSVQDLEQGRRSPEQVREFAKWYHGDHGHGPWCPDDCGKARES